VPRVLRYGGQRRAGEACGGNVIEADDRRFRNAPAGVLERVHRADCSDIACSEDRVELDCAVEQLLGGRAALRFIGSGIGAQRFVRFDSGGVQGARIAAQAFLANPLNMGEGKAPAPDDRAAWQAIVDAGNLSSAHNGGLALDLAPAGVNPDDAGDGDTGPNELLNRPNLTAAVPDAGSQVGHVAGSLDAVPNSTYEIHFYLNDTCDAGGSGGGQTLFPSTFASVTTDAGGHASFTQPAQFLPAGRYLTALARAFSTTAVIPALMTSEFSNCVLIGAGDTIFANSFD